MYKNAKKTQLKTKLKQPISESQWKVHLQEIKDLVFTQCSQAKYLEYINDSEITSKELLKMYESFSPTDFK